MAIARISIRFGLVDIPVTVHAAVEQHGVPLHEVHAADGARIRHRRVCEAEGVEVPYEDIARGYTAPDGRTVVLTDDDLADLPMPSARAIDVLAFIPADHVNVLQLERAYYLSASGAAGRPYVLLREAMTESSLVGVARMALRTRETLAVLRVRGDVICAQTMCWPDEIRPTTGLAPAAPLPRRQEVQMAIALMNQLTQGFVLEEQRDAYREAVEVVVSDRLAGVEPPHAPAARVVPTGVEDLMAALEASVQEVRERRGR